MPGAIVMTRMWCQANSRESGRVMATTPPFDAEYAGWPIWPSKAATDAVITTTPRSSRRGSVSCIAAAVSRIALKVPTRLTRMTRSKSSSGNGPVRGCDTGAGDEDAQRPERLRDPDGLSHLGRVGHVRGDECCTDLGGD